MQFYKNQLYHLFNRTNNKEALFKERENYLYFLRKYRFYLDEYLDTIAYCMMPTHFHFLIRVKNSDESNSDYSKKISHNIGIVLSSYTKALNKRFDRHGSLFQKHSKIKFIGDNSNLINVLTYIHQNPIRSNLVEKAEDWEFSSYQDYIDFRSGSLPKKEVILTMIQPLALRQFTEKELLQM